MKKICRMICVVFLLSVVLMSGSFSKMNSLALNSDEETAVSFIKNVLPLDSSKYVMTRESGSDGILTYRLESKDSVVRVICTVRDNAVITVQTKVVEGEALCVRTYSTVVEAAEDLLQKYQSNSGLDSTSLLSMLSNVKSVENKSFVSGDMKLVVTHNDFAGTGFGDSVNFQWIRSTNGCDYPLLRISFSDGFFYSLNDQRSSVVGDVSVRISMEEAVRIALGAVEGYSYRMTSNWTVSGFGVLESRIEAVLRPQSKEGVLYPSWDVIVPLDGVYPGSVRGILVRIWAGTGEVYSVSHTNLFNWRDLPEVLMTGDSVDDSVDVDVGFDVVGSDVGLESASVSLSYRVGLVVLFVCVVVVVGVMVVWLVRKRR